MCKFYGPNISGSRTPQKKEGVQQNNPKIFIEMEYVWNLNLNLRILQDLNLIVILKILYYKRKFIICLVPYFGPPNGAQRPQIDN